MYCLVYILSTLVVLISKDPSRALRREAGHGRGAVPAVPACSSKASGTAWHRGLLGRLLMRRPHPHATRPKEQATSRYRSHSLRRSGMHERAVQYFRRALRLKPDYLSAWTLMGHEYVELKNPPAAIGGCAAGGPWPAASPGLAPSSARDPAAPHSPHTRHAPSLPASNPACPRVPTCADLCLVGGSCGTCTAHATCAAPASPDPCLPMPHLSVRRGLPACC